MNFPVIDGFRVDQSCCCREESEAVVVQERKWTGGAQVPRLKEREEEKEGREG